MTIDCVTAFQYNERRFRRRSVWQGMQIIGATVYHNGQKVATLPLRLAEPPASAQERRRLARCPTCQSALSAASVAAGVCEYCRFRANLESAYEQLEPDPLEAPDPLEVDLFDDFDYAIIDFVDGRYAPHRQPGKLAREKLYARAELMGRLPKGSTT